MSVYYRVTSDLEHGSRHSPRDVYYYVLSSRCDVGEALDLWYRLRTHFPRALSWIEQAIPK